jgi:hypothetical protein
MAKRGCLATGGLPTARAYQAKVLFCLPSWWPKCGRSLGRKMGPLVLTVHLPSVGEVVGRGARRHHYQVEAHVGVLVPLVLGQEELGGSGDASGLAF